MAPKHGRRAAAKTKGLPKRRVVFASAYTVPIGKGVSKGELRKLVQRIGIPLADLAVRSRLERLVSSGVHHPIDVMFRTHDNKQQNPIHALVRRLAEVDRQDQAARDLAVALASAMDQRSESGLLVVAVSESDRGRRGVHIWKFPSDDGFGVAKEHGASVLRVLENAFAAGSALVKGAVFDDDPGPPTAYWEGQVEDRQVKIAASRPSAFWTDDFLDVRLRVTPRQGTLAVVGALKDVLDELSDGKVQIGVGQVPVVLQNWAGQERRVSDIADLLPAAARSRFVARIADAGYGESTKFEIDRVVLSSAAQFQTWRFESGVVIAVPIRQARNLVSATRDGDYVVVEVRGKASSTLRSKA